MPRVRVGRAGGITVKGGPVERCGICFSHPCECGAQTWRVRGVSTVVTFPCWIFTPGFGVSRAMTWNNLNELWTRWMPMTDPLLIPKPPNEFDVETTSRAGCVEAGERIREAIYSPARIQILLRCHVSPEPLPNCDAPVSAETIREFLQLGVIEPYGPIEPGPQRYRTTALGRAWVQALCNVPCPRVVYLDEQGRDLGKDLRP